MNVLVVEKLNHNYDNEFNVCEFSFNSTQYSVIIKSVALIC